MVGLSKTEKVTLRLVQSDLMFLNTIARQSKYSDYSYAVAFLPYMGMIIDGCEKWGNQVAVIKNNIPSFTDEEKSYYVELRNSIKLWETPLAQLTEMLEKKYYESDRYFASICKPIARYLKWYDIFSCYTINGKFCDNTILDMLFIPNFQFAELDGQYIRNMAIFAGRLASAFGIRKENQFPVDTGMKFKTIDYGGILKSPMGNHFSNEFVLFSILSTINFIVVGINEYIRFDIPAKLRLSYIQYYYLAMQLSALNEMFKHSFYLNPEWIDSQHKFRNCMAHYGLGVALKQNEVDENDLFGGLTIKYFKKDWITLLELINAELVSFATQISVFLKLK